jgi:hypothetical protein
MIKKIPFKAAIHGTILMLGLIIVFHLLVLLHIIPFTIVWGGRLKNGTEMLRFEIAAVIINALLIAVIAIKGRYLKFNIPSKIITIILWLFVGLFSLNTLGNLAAKTTMETVIFTPLTFMLAILCLRTVLEKNHLKE